MPIRLTKVNKSFGDPPTQVLHDITFEVEDGDFVAITGRSGSGKSTLLYIASTLDQPTTGEVRIDGIPVSRLNVPALHQFRNEKMGFIFQFHYLLPELSAVENVLMPSLKHNQSASRRARAVQLLKRMDLGDKLDRIPSKLSGGEQQRVAIARALLMNPRYLFADEPTGNLDTANGEMVIGILQEASRESGTSVLMVTHDKDFAARAKWSLHLVDGRQVKAK